MVRAIPPLILMVVVVFIVGSLSTGGDSLDINQKLIATTIAIDRRDGEVWFYVEFANIEASQGSSSGASNASTKYTTVIGHGKTLPDARENLNRQLDKPIYLSGVRTLLLTERFAQYDLVEYLYRLRADEAYRKKVITIITRDDLDTLYKAMHDQGESLGYSVENTIGSLVSSGQGFSRSTSRILENLSDTYTGILIPCVGLQGKEMALTGYTVVNDTKAIGFIPIEDARGVSILKADGIKIVYTVPYQDNLYTVEASLSKRTVKTSYENGQAVFRYSFAFDATIEYGSKKLPYSMDDAAEAGITDALQRFILQDVMDAITQAQVEYKTDYLQLDDAFRVTYPVAFESLNWGDVYAGAKIGAEVKVNLTTTYFVDYSAEEMK